MKTKIISLILALATMLSLCPMTYAATDVANTKYESAVESLEELGIINGYEDGTYKPEKEITRAEITKIIVVMLKLDTVADLYKGKTKFIDVAENHWATGFINIAAEYNIINGYEDNSFKPNAPVRYSEAVTMITRALGYKTMIEGKGTWPINYISKAQDLGILKGISYGNYNDNAIRGDIALLAWNALNIPTWGVISETEGDGLTFGKCPTLLEKNFKDYIYAEDLVEDIFVKDGKVTLTLKGIEKELELAKNIEFLNLKGRNITYTYNSKEEKIIQLTVSDKDKVIKGYLSDLEKDYDFTKVNSQVWGAAKSGDTDYVVAVLGKEKAAAYMTRYSIKSHIVNNVKISKDKLKVNGNALSIDKDAIILIDNEWKTIEDVKVGDIITCLKTNELYVVSRKTVKGTFEAITETKNTKYITVNKAKYSILNGTKEVVELDSDGDKIAATPLTDILNNKDSKFYGKKATLYINFLNEVAKITFDEIQEEDTGKFYIATYVHGYWTNIEQNGRKIYAYTELNGKEYEIKKGFNYPTIQGGDLVYAKFSGDKIDSLQNITWDNVPAIENYEIHYLSGEGLMDDNYYINEHKVSNSTIIVKVNAIEIENYIDRYELEYLDREDIKNVKKCIVITDTNDNFNKAKYIFIWEDIENTNKNYGVVEMCEKTNGKCYLIINNHKYELESEKKGNKEYITINNHKYELDSLEVDYIAAALEDQAIEYIINDGTIKVTGIITYASIERAPKVTAAEDDNYILDDSAEIKELNKDEIYLIAEIDEDEKKITSIKKVDYKNVILTKGDKVLITPTYTLIVK